MCQRHFYVFFDAALWLLKLPNVTIQVDLTQSEYRRIKSYYPMMREMLACKTRTLVRKTVEKRAGIGNNKSSKEAPSCLQKCCRHYVREISKAKDKISSTVICHRSQLSEFPLLTNAKCMSNCGSSVSQVVSSLDKKSMFAIRDIVFLPDTSFPGSTELPVWLVVQSTQEPDSRLVRRPVEPGTTKALCGEIWRKCKHWARGIWNKHIGMWNEIALIYIAHK
jgi:hypothetical protein